MQESDRNPIQEIKTQVKQLFDQGIANKQEGKQIEALKKFDEAQLLIKHHFGENSEQLS